jgi:hypothetical protein
MAFGALGGPSVGVGAQAIGAASELIQRKNTPTDTSRLKGKLAVGVTPDSYTDATPAARFALQQVPVVGTPIKNRLLPFAKESNADAGKPTVDGKGNVTEKALTVDQRLKMAFSSPDAKKFLALSPADQKALAETDPNARELYNEMQGVRKAFSTQKLRPMGLDADYAKKELGLDNFDPAFVLNHYDRLSDKAKEAQFNKQNDAEAVYKISKYLEDKAAGKISEVDQLKKQNELAKLYVGKDFDKSTRDFFGLNKTELWNYITTNQNGKALSAKLLAYDDALTKAGVQKKNKFRDKYGNVDFDPSSNGSGGKKGGSGGRGKNPSADAPEIATALYTRPKTFAYKRYSFGGHKVTSGKRISTKNEKISLKTKA